MHTVATDSDAGFSFSLDKLKEYVETRAIDCIAITNHNTFELNQFRVIKSQISSLVLPGIEIDLEGGQLLLIADGTDAEDFADKCKKITDACPTKKASITVDQLKSIFSDLSKYILIPHYDKEPKIKDETLVKLHPFVTAGEVTSPKKFIYCQKTKDRLVPVYFSDCRLHTGLKEYSLRQTYVDCEESTFAAIKNCLRDKSKVALSENDGNFTFQIFGNGQKLSTGLNVIIGGRSSGKTYTLQKICETCDNVKYLPQFSLIAKDEEKDEKRFSTILSQGHSLHSNEYLKELQGIVDDVVDVDLESNARSVSNYLDTLLRSAKETERQDAFSNAKLFNEEEFQILDQKGLVDLISSTKNLIENLEFRETIEKHLPLQNLKALIVTLMQEHRKREEEIRKMVWLNELIKDIKAKLHVRSAATSISDINLYKIAMDLNKVEKFKKAILLARKKREIKRTPVQGFEIVASVGEFQGAGELKNLSRLKAAFSDAYSKYHYPYEYLQELKNINNLEAREFYRYFVKVDYKVLNKDGFEVSGGERSEFNLLQEIQDAQRHDMLLIDEPESSFDNLFLKNEVNELIKDIAKTMPVVLVTHNSTVGASIKPDYMLYTKKEILDGKVQYQIYSGAPSSKKLVSINGAHINTWDATLGCLEAGENAYNERRQGYEDLKN